MPPNKRRGPAKRSGLKAVPDPVDESAPKDADTPFPMSAREKQESVGAENMAKGRARLAELRANARAAREAGVPTRLSLYREGKLPFDEWTDEELGKGRPAGLNGIFDGAGPKFTPKEHAQIRVALLKRGERLLESYYVGALKVLEEVARSGESEPSRVKAANLIIERTAGRTVEKIEIKSSDPWQDILDEVLEDEVLERMQDSPTE